MRPHTKEVFENIVKQICSREILAKKHERVFFAILYMSIKEEREKTEEEEQKRQLISFSDMKNFTVKQKKVWFDLMFIECLKV